MKPLVSSAFIVWQRLETVVQGAPRTDVAEMGFPARWEQIDIWQEKTA